MKIYNAARTVAMQLIETTSEDLTVTIIRDCVESAAGLIPLAPEDVERLITDLEATYQTVIGEERELVGEDEGWSPWLLARRGEVEWRYWERYKELLRRGPMNEGVRFRLDTSTDRVLGLLGDPERKGTWDRRGLVVGLVQSGKTSHYMGLINKAVDAGYKVVVVLTGFTESLRVQTQVRAEEGFLGYYMTPKVRKQDAVANRVGVGLISPGLQPHSVTTRHNDFKSQIAGNFGITPGGDEILFVIKKNVSVLRNLLGWIESFGNATDSEGRRFVKDVPLLVVDDESDVGSIDTKKGNIIDDDPDPEHEPSRINELIRRLLSLFDQSSYVGYTATPFANVLIHDGGHTETLGEDLFPRSFIVSLPTASDHVGPGLIFGEEIPGEAPRPSLPILRPIPEDEEGAEAWIPRVHKKHTVPSFGGREEVPPSLRTAVMSFVLSCVARRLRGQGSQHNSMLVHVTRFNDVQEHVETQVRRELQRIVERLQHGTADKRLLSELETLWVEDFTQTTRAISTREGAQFKNPIHDWDDVHSELLSVAAAIQVRTINGLAKEVLDYVEHPEGLSVIAIGGDKLSRGLTLEGLSVSYFLRSSRMYDTLMQMGRWFGYRPGYLDLCRLYTTSELEEWFGHIATATEELRREFDFMADSGRTPKDFGLRVRSHPQLMVTSRVKMRHGKALPVTFDGRAPEINNFHRDEATVKRNWEAFEDLIGVIESDGEGHTVNKTSLIWSGVGPEAVGTFLERYREHDANHMSRTTLLAEYIRKEVKANRLKTWTVVLSQGNGRGEKVGRVEFRTVNRGWRGDKQSLISEGRFRTGILKDPKDEGLDLPDPQWDSAMAQTLAEWERDPTGRKNRPILPSGDSIRRERDPRHGLVAFYVIDPAQDKTAEVGLPLVGWAVSFPTVKTGIASQLTYTVNNVYQLELGV